MLTRHLAVVAALALVGPVLAASCVAPIESSSEGAGGANMTPAEREPTTEIAEDLKYCECSTQSDFCPLTVGGHCVAGFNSCTKSPLRGCGFLGAYQCVGWCVRP